MNDECISVACPRCGLTFTDFINSELQRKLDEEQKAHFEEHIRFVKLEYIAMDLQKRLDIAVDALKYYAKLEMREIGILHNVAEEALKKLEK